MNSPVSRRLPAQSHLRRHGGGVKIKPIAEKNGLTITKPDRYRAGGTSTLAIVQNAFQADNIGNFDVNGFLTTLKQLEKTLDEYTNEKNTAGNSGA